MDYLESNYNTQQVVNDFSIEKKNELQALVKDKGFMTGSYHFFGEGEDIDYVIKKSDIEAYDPELIPDDTLLRPRSFISYTIDLRKLRPLNIIVVSDDWFIDWLLATEQFVHFLGQQHHEAYMIFKTNKKVRVHMFDAYLGGGNTENQRRG